MAYSILCFATAAPVRGELTESIDFDVDEVYFPAIQLAPALLGVLSTLHGRSSEQCYAITSIRLIG